MTDTITKGQAEACLKIVQKWIESKAGADREPTLYEPGFHANGWTIGLEGLAHLQWPWSISQDESVTWPDGVWVEAGTDWYLSLNPTEMTAAE